MLSAPALSVPFSPWHGSTHPLPHPPSSLSCLPVSPFPQPALVSLAHRHARNQHYALVLNDTTRPAAAAAAAAAPAAAAPDGSLGVHWLGWGPMVPLLAAGERPPHEGATGAHAAPPGWVYCRNRAPRRSLGPGVGLCLQGPGVGLCFCRNRAPRPSVLALIPKGLMGFCVGDR